MAPSDPTASPLALPLPHAGLPVSRDTTADVTADARLEAERQVLRLFDEYQRPLARYILSLGLNAADTEDVVQEVFMALFRHLADRRPATNLPAWLFQVARNLALKHRRRGQRWWRWLQAAAPLPEEPADPAAGPELQLADAQQHQQWQRILQALPDRDRQVLVLRAEGLSYRDIAQALGISLGLVAKSLARSLARFERAEARS